MIDELRLMKIRKLEFLRELHRLAGDEIATEDDADAASDHAYAIWMALKTSGDNK